MQGARDAAILHFMKEDRFRGPLVSLAAVAALGGGLWWLNVAQEDDTAAPASPIVQTSIAPAPPPPRSARPAPDFPAKANYVGKVPAQAGAITLEITVNGGEAVAYACDGNSVEVWLRGSAKDGALSLTSKDAKSRLQGRPQGTSVAATLWIGEKRFDFTTAPVQAPAGLYVYEDNGVRSSWIVDQNGDVTGVQRGADGSTSPASDLSSNGTAVVDGQSVTATRVEGP